MNNNLLQKNYKYKVGLDVDDVLFHCIGLALDLEKEKNPELDLEMDDIKSWISPEMKAGVLLKYFDRPDFYERQTPLDGAIEFVNELTKRAEVFFVTAVSNEFMGIRGKQLRKFFPNIPEKNFIPASRKNLVTLDFLLDDRSENILASNAKYPVIFRKPWNKGITGILSVGTYTEFLDIFDCITGYKENPTPSNILVLIGPSASGKSVIAEKLEETGFYERPISSTTRRPRKGETEKSYHFLTETEFKEKMDNDEFLENSIYSGNRYGLEKSSVFEILAKNKKCVIVADISGAMALKMSLGATLIFVKRETKEILHTLLERIRKGEMTPEDMEKRLVSLTDEKKNENICDYTLMNRKSVADSAAELLEEFYWKDRAYQ